MTAAEFTWAIGRATVFTSASVLAAILLLRLLNIRSPRIHRAAWLLAVLPGWLLVPWTWQFQTPPDVTPAETFRAEVLTTVTLSQPAPTAVTPAAAHAARMSPAQPLLVVYLGGMIAVIATGLLRYVRFVRQLPCADDVLDPEWQQEWNRQLRALRIGRRIDLGVTPELGPLLCFVPYHYLVLVPRPLWAALARRQRIAILRHELAHWLRGDLWWSLAIRALALPQWFNPLIWLAARRFDEAGEWACDDLVSRGRRSHELAFARSLLASAEFATTNSPGTAAIQGGQLARRVRRLVSHRFKEEAMAKKLLVLVPMAAIVLVQAIRIEHVTAEEPAQTSSGPPDKLGIEVEPTSPAPDGIRPAYVIEPPDVLTINAIKLVPRPPHRIEPFDALLVRVIGTIPDRPIADTFAVDPDGKIDLGPPYGRVEVAGLTIDEVRETLIKHLSDVLENPEVSVSLAFSAGAQQIKGEHRVGPDGRVNLGIYGMVFVAGMTVEEARAAIEKQLAQELVDPKVVVDVFAYNSKKYYVINRNVGHGDQVTQAPLSGNETVLDAVAAIGGLSQLATKKLWISRPSPRGDGRDTTLPINWDDIANGTSLKTNHQLLPNDRLFIVNTADAADTNPKPTPDIEAPQPPSTYYYSVQNQLKQIAASKSKSVSSVEFNIDMIEDRTGALAEYASMRGEAPFVAVDSKTIGPALRVLSKHGLVQQTASPKITCRLGETATMVVNATDKEEPNAERLNLKITARETDLGMLMELHLKANRGGPAQGIDFAVYLKPGQTVILPVTKELSKIKTGDEPHPVYLAITPSLPGTPPTAAGQDAPRPHVFEPPKAE